MDKNPIFVKLARTIYDVKAQVDAMEFALTRHSTQHVALKNCGTVNGAATSATRPTPSSKRSEEMGHSTSTNSKKLKGMDLLACAAQYVMQQEQQETARISKTEELTKEDIYSITVGPPALEIEI